MMDLTTDENVQTLMGMGFYDEVNIRKALELAKNDLNEAVSYLTCEMPMSSYDIINETEMNEPMQGIDYGQNQSPPSYDEVTKDQNNSSPVKENDDDNMDFPYQHLVELEGRVYTDSWSIPFRKDESFAKCLNAATKLIKHDLHNHDENCKRFLEHCLPECFNKLLTANAVYRWFNDVQEGINDMLHLFLDLLLARLQHKPLPITMLEILAKAFDPDSAWSCKNKQRTWNQQQWTDKLDGEEKLFARPPGHNDDTKGVRHEYGWMITLVNTFCYKGGLEEMRNAMERNEEQMDAVHFTAILRPFAACVDCLNPARVQSELAPIVERVVAYVRELSEDDFKLKKLGTLSELLAALKQVCRVMWCRDVSSVDDLRLDITLRMMKCPHFNAKMNALKEVTKLIDECRVSYNLNQSDNACKIDREKVLEWLVDNTVLSISLDGHIDQSQYCDKIRSVVEFIGDKLSLDELAQLWKLQNNASLAVAENVQSIVAGAAPQFNEKQLDLLFLLVHKSWLSEDERAKQQLVSFIGRIGHNSKTVPDMEKVLTLLWDLAHLPRLSPHLVELALHEHNSILTDSYLIRDSLKKSFVLRCIEDIKKDQWIVPALRQMHDISKALLKSQLYKQNKSERAFLSELNRTQDLLKLVVTSLTRCHQMAVEACRQQQIQLNGQALVDDRYSHSDYMWWHMNFLKFLLKEGDLYLSWNRARDVWDTLVNNKEACVEDIEACSGWFVSILDDLDQDAIKTIFKERLLKADVTQMTTSYFRCYIAFMESANMCEQKIKKVQADISVEKLDLVGIDNLWRVCMECGNMEVVDRAVKSLVKYSFVDVSHKLKKDVVALHSRFLSECYRRLHACNNGEEEGATIAEAVTMTTKTLAANVMPADVTHATLAAPRRTSSRALHVERVLTIVYQYIADIELGQQHDHERAVLPHGQHFRGPPIQLELRCDTTKEELALSTHGNDSVRNVRIQAARWLDTTPDNVQLIADERVIPFNNDRMLLHNCKFNDSQVIMVKTTTATTSMQIDDDSSNHKANDIDQKLPSNVLASLGEKVYDSLFQLTDLDQPQISACVRRLLLILPTDARIRHRIETPDPVDSGLDDDDMMMTSPAGEDGMTINDGGGMKSRRSRGTASFLSLFRITSPGMNLFRLRYNLEVLSSLLMPVSDQQIEESGAFIRSFLHNNGLHTLLNILQREILQEPASDPDTKRGCYSVALSIAKFLLCAASCCEKMTHHVDGNGNPSNGRSVGSEAAVSPLKRDSFRVGSAEVTSATPVKRNRRSVSRSPAVIPAEIPQVAKTTVQVMNGEEFGALIHTLIRITWYASAGKLDQLTSLCEEGSVDEGLVIGRCRKCSRDSSTSTSSTAVSPFRHHSESSVSSNGSYDVTSAADAGGRGGVSGSTTQHDDTNSNTDSYIARQALQLLVSCLQHRASHLEVFFESSYIGEFVIDVLTRSCDKELREHALEQFHLLSNVDSAMKKFPPRQLMLQILSKARLPFWHQSTILRPKPQQLVKNCLQYFELRGKLIHDAITHDQMKQFGLDEVGILRDEITWLLDFEIPTSSEYAESSSARHLDNVLLTGHLRLIKVLLQSPKVVKKDVGGKLIARLLSEFLFPASKLILESTGKQSSNQPITGFQPKCSAEESRLACFDVLAELCRECTENLSLVSSQLISMHHYTDQSRAKEFGFSPLVVERPEHGFVGLRNGGATCYMNSVLQQLFMINQTTQRIMCSDVVGDGGDDVTSGAPETSLFYQLQKVFAHLRHSRLQFHEPATFWKTFRLWGQEVNVREQQDAFEFLTDLTDQIDEFIKSKNQEGIYRSVFKGVFSDQKICEGCPHRYDREEPYFALNLPVKCGSLEDSLKQFVAGEKLEGDNAYFCEKCNEKRTALKRTCIKSLPQVLVIQLKRFGYDWEAGRSLKFDQYFRFPLQVDMQPYVTDGTVTSSTSGNHQDKGEAQMYQLAGVVIHSGQAQAGHYYSIIRDRRGTPMTNPHHGKWYKFNDTTVEEFRMEERSFEEECFGGTFTSKVYEKGMPYDEERLRYWNAYLLFYERVEPAELKSSTKSRVSFVRHAQVFNTSNHSSPDNSPPPSPRLPSSPRHPPPASPRPQRHSSLSQLSNLIKKGEQRGIFTPQIPSSIMQLVREENLQFVRHRGMYSPHYFHFIRRLVQINLPHASNYPAIAVTSLQLATQFLFQTFFRTKRDEQLAPECEEWESTVQHLLTASQPACVWFASQLKSQAGFASVTAFLLECPYEVVRKTFAHSLSCTLRCLAQPSIPEEKKLLTLDPILSRIVALLDREVAERVKHSCQFFTLLADFSAQGSFACHALLRHNVFARLMKFLLGETATRLLFQRRLSQDGGGDATTMSTGDNNNDVTTTTSASPSNGGDDVTTTTATTRRWSSSQSRDFSALHKTIANVVLTTDLAPLRGSPGCGDGAGYAPRTIAIQPPRVPLSDAVRLSVEGPVAKRYFRELLLFVRENWNSADLAYDVILHCAYDNQAFSTLIIEIIMSEIGAATASELSTLLMMLVEVLSLPDTLHRTRLTLAFDHHHFFDVIKTSQRGDEAKCYQCVKMLVQLATRNEACHQYLMEITAQWSWSVTWLKRKMNEYSWNTVSTSSNSSSSSSSRSNDTSKHFQRTMSAQNTLDEATALLARGVPSPTANHQNGINGITDASIDDDSVAL